MTALAALALLTFAAAPAHAYIGPGAGFAIGTTLLTVFIAFFSAIGALLIWPFRWLIRMIKHRKAHARARVKRVIVLGLDGVDAKVTERLMDEGKLPNFQRLRERGTYTPLATTAPAMTPVAWASFLTGCNPGKHNIFDFLTRDKRTYTPALSSVHIGPPRRVLKLGKYRIPIGKPDIRLHRKGVPFWNTLGEHGIFANIIRMPITFPPEKFRGVLLSSMCVPDLRGSQGTFSFYSTSSNGDGKEFTGGEQIRVQRDGNRIRSHLVGPENTLVDKGGIMNCPFNVEVHGPDSATITVDGTAHKLQRNRYSPWINVSFKAGMGIKVKGICQFLLLSTEPEFRLYVTPIQIDPASPALQISHPKVYATYFAKLMGPYATIGLAEDTWAMNAKILDDDAFLHQCDEADDERIEMLFDALDKVRQGLVVCVIDGPDRVNHMFWRYLDDKHPALQHTIGTPRPDAIEKTYQKMDGVVGRLLDECNDPDTLVLVMSDHGCASFRRGVDLNYWLEQNGYLKLKEGSPRDAKYLQSVDWSQTKAYCLGLTGIWLNVKDRESKGIVEPAEIGALCAEIASKLNGLKDPEKGETAINRVYPASQIYRGPYKGEAPDLIVGYNDGYRVSWEAALGQPTDALFHDNTKAWSGDHIIDPKLVPGVLFANRKVTGDRFHITDLAPTILDLFGVDVPGHMDGRKLNVADANGVVTSAPKSPRVRSEPATTPAEG